MAWRNWRGRQVINIAESRLSQAVEDTLNEVLTGARGEVPLDEGTLEHSGRVIMQPGKPSGCVCYGGGSGTGFPVIPYAIRWHERQANFQHGRKRNYLRDPFNRIALRSLRSNIERNRF